MEPDILRAIEPIIDRFEGLSIPYQIGGSVASSIYGIARSTIDVDMLVDLRAEHIDAWVDGIEDRYYIARERVRDAVERHSSFNVIHLETMIKVDIFVAATEAYSQECLRRSHLETLADSSQHQFSVASPEDVVLHKLIWYRKGGETSERQWTDVKGVLQVQGSSLDVSYMRKWAQRLAILDLLQRAIQAVNPPPWDE